MVPDAIPALVCPIIFNYKPNAVLIGFMLAMITSTLMIFLENTFNVLGDVIIPLVITSFFECGATAVIGEGQGGIRGVVIWTTVAAVFMITVM